MKMKQTLARVLAKMNAVKERTDAVQREMKAEMRTSREELRTDQEEMTARLEAKIEANNETYELL
jgi:BMFP domain-containing protein YqiC